MSMKQILGWVVVAVTTLFVAFNLASAEVWFFGIRARMPIALVVIASAGLGVLGTLAFTTFKRRPKPK